MTAKIAVTFNDIKVVDYGEILRLIWKSDKTRNWVVYSTEQTLRFWQDSRVTKQRKAEEQGEKRDELNTYCSSPKKKENYSRY